MGIVQTPRRVKDICVSRTLLHSIIELSVIFISRYPLSEPQVAKHDYAIEGSKSTKIKNLIIARKRNHYESVHALKDSERGLLFALLQTPTVSSGILGEFVLSRVSDRHWQRLRLEAQTNKEIGSKASACPPILQFFVMIEQATSWQYDEMDSSC